MAYGIHPIALVDTHAELDASVTVGPYTVIGPYVTIGAGTTVGAHCVDRGAHPHWSGTTTFFQFNSLAPFRRTRSTAGNRAELHIGDRNTIREFQHSISGSPGDLGKTVVGDDNWIMAYVHLAHDCVVGNHTIFANNPSWPGMHVGDWAILGGFTLVHQFVRIGAHVMTAICSVLLADLPPFGDVPGQPAAARSMNFEGLRRRGWSPERISGVAALHKILYPRGPNAGAGFKARMVELAAQRPRRSRTWAPHAGVSGTHRRCAHVR